MSNGLFGMVSSGGTVVQDVPAGERHAAEEQGGSQTAAAERRAATNARSSFLRQRKESEERVKPVESPDR